MNIECEANVINYSTPTVFGSLVRSLAIWKITPIEALPTSHYWFIFSLLFVSASCGGGWVKRMRTWRRIICNLPTALHWGIRLFAIWDEIMSCWRPHFATTVSLSLRLCCRATKVYRSQQDNNKHKNRTSSISSAEPFRVCVFFSLALFHFIGTKRTCVRELFLFFQSNDRNRRHADGTNEEKGKYVCVCTFFDCV